MQDFISKSLPDSFSCTFSSTLTNVDKAIACFKKFLDSGTLNLNKFETSYIVREALNNAVVHGNRKNDKLQVTCSLEFKKNVLTISVTDEGHGFNWHNQLRTKPVSSDATSGRGLKSMHRYGFEVEFNDSGNTLYLTKKIM